jgi:diguanylate cyclase (GGDEF)-like protein
MVESASLSISSRTSSFYEILDYEFQRAVRYKNVITLMFIRLCHLDEIVRKYGQQTAEQTISEIERLIRSNIRNTDRGFIYGKDEFMIILPNTQKDGAHSMIPKLKRVIESYRLTNEKGAVVTLTPQFGIASYKHNPEVFAGKIKTADNVPALNPVKRGSSRSFEQQVAKQRS